MVKKNGFVMYAASRRAEFLAAGYTLEGGMKDLVNLSSKDWEKLPKEERDKFSDQAKRYNEQGKQQGGGGTGPQPSSQTERKSRKAKFEEKKVPMVVADPDRFTEEDFMLFQENREILNQLFENQEVDWKDQPIVICTFTMYAEPGYGLMYLPAEVGLTAMSLKEGVIDNFARIIDPGEIPQCYGIEAFDKAEKLGLPEPGIGRHPELAAVEPLMMILGDFLKMRRANLPGEDLYVFAFDSEFLMVKRCLEWLIEKSNYPLSPPVKILSLDQYAYMASTRACLTEAFLNAVQGKENGSGTKSSYREPGKSLTGSFVYSSQHPTCAQGIFLTVEDVEKCIKDVDNYKYYEELCCIYHLKNGSEVQNCALTTSNRYAFCLLEILTISCKVPIIPGGHFPEIHKNSKREKTRRYNMLARWGITDLEERMKVRNHAVQQDEKRPDDDDGRARLRAEWKMGLGEEIQTEIGISRLLVNDVPGEVPQFRPAYFEEEEMHFLPPCREDRGRKESTDFKKHSSRSRERGPSRPSGETSTKPTRQKSTEATGETSTKSAKPKSTRATGETSTKPARQKSTGATGESSTRQKSASPRSHHHHRSPAARDTEYNTNPYSGTVPIIFTSNIPDAGKK